MNVLLETAAPTFHALTGTQPVGQTQIAVRADYAGTITTVTRVNGAYWSVTTRSARNAFRGPWSAAGASAAIWLDRKTNQFVTDYWVGSTKVEVGRSRALPAAIGLAAFSTGHRFAALAR